MNDDIYLSIIIPAYNERARIGVTLESVAAYLKTKPFKAEVIVVDDGSSDGTTDFARGFSGKFRHFSVMEYGRNRGKGYAVKQGMLSARGRLRLFMDADNSITIDNFDAFVKHIEAGADIVIGSIELPGSTARDDNQWYRRGLGKICKVTIRALVTPNIYDTIRGFKLFTTAAADSVFQAQTIERFGFDTELVAIAQTKGFVIHELQVKWDNPSGNSVNLGSYIFGFWELIKIKRNMMMGKYGPAQGSHEKHVWAIVLALLIGLSMIAPQLVFIHSLGRDYHGLYMMAGDDEEYYLARMHEAYQGQIGADPYIYEARSGVPPAILSVAEPVLAAPGILLGISAPTLSLAYKFILPTLIALLVYSLFWRLTGSRGWSAAAMCAIMLGANFLNAPDILHILRFDASYTSFWGFAPFARPVYPEFSSIFFFLYLHLLVSAVRERTRKWYVYLGLIFGATFYIYIYTVTFLAALNAVFVVGLFLAKRRREAGMLALATAGGVAIGSYFIYDLIVVTRSPYYADFAANTKLTLSHAPIVSFAGCIALAVFLGYLFLKKRRTGTGPTGTEYLLLGLLVTAFAVINQQIITGRLLQEGHYHWHFNVPIFIMALLFVLAYALKGRPRLAMAAIVIITVMSFWTAALFGYASYKSEHAAVASEQRYMPLMDWLNAHAPSGSVVFADKDLTPLIPVYTFDYIVWDSAAANYLMPHDRSLFTQDAILAAGFAPAVKRYRVDYVVWDTVKDPSWKMDQYKSLRQVYETGGLKVYAL